MRLLGVSRAHPDILVHKSSKHMRRTRTLTTISSAAAFQIWRQTNAAHSPSEANTPSNDVLASPTEPWLTAFLLIGFDLDKGQVVEACVPEHALTYDEKEAVCYHAMPDSSAGGKGHEDAVYSFRIRRHLSDESGDDDHTLLLAHCIFRQAPDRTNPRGFFQKALVVISSVPCIQLYQILLSSIVSTVFVDGPTALEKAVENIAAWPHPKSVSPDTTLHLKMVEKTISITLPQSILESFAAPSANRKFCTSPTSITYTFPDIDDEEQEIAISKNRAGAQTPKLVRSWPLCSPSSHPTAPPFHEVEIVQALRGVLEKMWTIWELILLGEPLLIFGDTPSQCSSAVLAVLGLIHPLPFVGDWRPYFCIQDSTYLVLAQAENASDVLPSGALYGITNCHMVDTLPFSHVLSLPGVEHSGKSYKPGLKTTHKPVLQRSKQLMNILSHALTVHGSWNGTGDPLAGSVRSCISDGITEPFLRAFNRYLVPTWNGVSVTEEPYASDPFGRWLGLRLLDLNTFPTDEDLGSPGVMSLFRSGVSRSKIRKLYRRFSKGTIFAAWWPVARSSAERECMSMHRTDLLEACFRGTGHSFAGRDDGLAVQCLLDLSMRVGEELEVCPHDDLVLKRKLRSLQMSLMQQERESLDYLESCSERSDEPLLAMR